MRSNKRLVAFVKTAALAVALFGSGAGVAADVDVYLQAQPFTKSILLPDTTSDNVPMWVFANCDSTFTTCTSDAPGPQIDATEGDRLIIHLKNTLSVPVSIIIPGQVETTTGANIPMMDPPDGQGRSRVRSFTHEVIGGATVDFEWNGLRAGTFLYQSGTYPSIQVPMGLYGALVVDSVAGVCTDPPTPAYGDDGSCYDDDVVMLFSEIDPVQNQAVVDAMGVVADYPSTIDYSPSYILINGELSPELPGIGSTTTPVESTVLLRMLNAGSTTHTPAVIGADMTLLAEDGNRYPGAPVIEAQALLPAGKTRDALIATPASDINLALVDRTPAFSNNDVPYLAAVGSLVVNNGGSDAAPTVYADNDTYSVDEDTPFVSAPDSVLDNDVGAVGATVSEITGPMHASAFALNADGTFTYTPEADYSGSDSFVYETANGYQAVVTLNISFVNDMPQAVADGPYANTFAGLAVDAAHGVLGNDTDVDGDVLTAVIDGVAPAGLTLNSDGSFSYSGAADTSFSYTACDAGLCSTPVGVTITYAAPSGISLTVLDAQDSTEIFDYRWVVQEDLTYKIANPDTPPAFLDQQSLNFHKSSMPVVAQGCRGCTPDVDNDPTGDFPGPGDVDHNGNGLLDTEINFAELVLDDTKHYYVSVLPNDAWLPEGTTDGLGNLAKGHTIGGAQIAPGQTSVTVLVNKQEIPTAQVAILVFEDNYPTNGVPDTTENGLGGWTVTLEDAGGRYGISGGTMSQDAFGNPLTNSLPCAPPAAPGVILTCDNGSALVENLPPGKYGIFATAPTAGGVTWTQTSTIEGTKIIDAWVEAGNPPFFAEFGVPNFHAFIGFVNPATTTIPPGPPVGDGPPPGGPRHTITGNVTLIHDSRPPDMTPTDTGSYDALAFTRAWIGLNSAAGAGPNWATVQAQPDGSFSIPDIPNGTYQLAIWDSYLDQIIAFQTVIVSGPTGIVDAGTIPVNAWFTRVEHNVYLDANGNGVRDDDVTEPGLPEQNINLRWRDGTVNQAFPTDLDGFVPFDQVFPFFHWQTWEVDYTRFRATGLTVTVDAGGDVNQGGNPWAGLLNPQAQEEDCVDGDCFIRQETGLVLTEAWQGFPGQTSIMNWGKAPYNPGENGGISGIVFYGSTRGEADPRLTVGDPWEPGIANVPVRLYKEVATADGGTGLVLIDEATTDSWDAGASLPTNCPGEVPAGSGDPFVDETLGGQDHRCYDGWRNWNQARPGIFDGGYAFTDIPAGNYVVEVVLPPGYELIREDSMNVGFGDSYGPFNTYASVSITLPNGMVATTIPDAAMIQAALDESIIPGIAQPECVGLYHEVPAELSLFPGEPTPFAGSWRPLCDRKRVHLPDQGQAAADFHVYTSAPVASQFSGLITDDIATETNQRSPGFGEKWSPAYMPLTLRDFNGNILSSGFTDAFGHYNGMLASTYTANVPIPSGYSPQMAFTCLNDPGDNPAAAGYVNPAYGRACYTLQFMPGTTTYLDTPILPHAAFAAGFNPVDCDCTDGTPVIEQVTSTSESGPLVNPGETLTIQAVGDVVVPNPAYEGPLGTVANHTIMRHYGFGGSGMMTLNGNPVPGTVSWGDATITWTVPGGFPAGEYQLAITNGDSGKSTKNAITVIVGPTAGTVHRVSPSVDPDATPVQDAIDAASPGDLILLAPGTYDELVVLWKPVRLQGAGRATFLDARQNPTSKVDDWRVKVEQLIDNGDVDLLPEQPAEFNLIENFGLFGTELGGGITVLANSDGSFGASASRIDGLRISNADGGGAIFANAYAHNLVISNNEITNNSGPIHGGIRVGHTTLGIARPVNTNVNIHHNSITKNGGMGMLGAGGGVSIGAGSDGYTIADNYICGNFKVGDGAGIGHLGLSNNGQILRNEVLFNQSINQGLTRNGGGILIAGEPAAGGLTPGAGNVIIDRNTIRGNQAASGHGGGIRTQLVNGQEYAANNQASNWYGVTMTNNMITNNVAAWSGAGISLQDTVKATIVLNTVANNDSTASVGDLIDAAGNSTAQPAGIASEQHSPELAPVRGGPDYSSPAMSHNIIWHNRAFHVEGTNQLLPALTPGAGFACPGGAVYSDLGVIGGPGSLSSVRSILTGDADPLLANEYCNGDRKLATLGPMQAAPATGEGGNFVDVRFGPLTTEWPVSETGVGSTPWDYHISSGSSAIFTSGGSPNAPTGINTDHDFDNEVRPNGPRKDAGADEYYAP